jgi:hydroxymethylbilane synthase
MTKPLVIGTRASKLARTQAEMLRAALLAAHPELTIELAAMTTAGDRELHKDIADWGYKGLFTRELEDGLLDGRVDLAVHSTKDMPSILPDGLVLAGVMERADVRDAWVSHKHASVETLPKGAVIGSSSTRRAAQVLHYQPAAVIVPFRGNVDTRLQKLEDGVAEGTFLAAAGLKRLGYEKHIRALIPTDVMLPAAAQGAIGIECKTEREDVRAMISAINHSPTQHCITAERAFLLALDGSCRTPIGGLAELRGGEIFMRGEVLSLDGRVRHYGEITGSANDAETLGRNLGEQLRREAGEELLQQGRR